jgi:hypothetical protein
MIDQQVAGQGSDPGLEAALGGVERGQVAVQLDKDILGQIFRVVGRGGEAVTERVDAALLGRHQLRPGGRIAVQAAPDQRRPIDLRRLGPPRSRPLPARITLRRRVRREIQRGGSSACRIGPPGVGLVALTADSSGRDGQRKRGGQTHACLYAPLPASVPSRLPHNNFRRGLCAQRHRRW